MECMHSVPPVMRAVSKARLHTVGAPGEVAFGAYGTCGALGVFDA